MYYVMLHSNGRTALPASCQEFLLNQEVFVEEHESTSIIVCCDMETAAGIISGLRRLGGVCDAVYLSARKPEGLSSSATGS